MRNNCSVMQYILINVQLLCCGVNISKLHGASERVSDLSQSHVLYLIPNYAVYANFECDCHLLNVNVFTLCCNNVKSNQQIIFTFGVWKCADFTFEIDQFIFVQPL